MIGLLQENGTSVQRGSSEEKLTSFSQVHATSITTRTRLLSIPGPGTMKSICTFLEADLSRP